MAQRLVDTLHRIGVEMAQVQERGRVVFSAAIDGSVWQWHQDYGYWYQNGCLWPDLLSVAVALEVALAACRAADRDPATLPSVFASTHGDLAITDYMCETLATDPTAVSPTKFHNSVHNAAAGYWTIGAGCTEAATAISAFDGTFAQGLLEAMLQLASGSEAVLLVAYDTAATGLLGTVTHSEGLLGAALVLSRGGAGPRLSLDLRDGDDAPATGPLAALAARNAMAQMLPLFDALACGAPEARLKAGPHRQLVVEIAR